jgi:hypothetical protein
VVSVGVTALLDAVIDEPRPNWWRVMAVFILVARGSARDNVELDMMSVRVND